MSTFRKGVKAPEHDFRKVRLIHRKMVDQKQPDGREIPKEIVYGYQELYYSPTQGFDIKKPFVPGKNEKAQQI